MDHFETVVTTAAAIILHESENRLMKLSGWERAVSTTALFVRRELFLHSLRKQGKRAAHCCFAS